MLFDSPRMADLRRRYENEEAYLLPKILCVDRLAELSGEKTALESILKAAPLTKQDQWLDALLSGSDDRFVPMWFEMMLFEWLLPLGEVSVEKGEDEPDYKVTSSEQVIHIEAKARVIPREERKHTKDSIRVGKALEKLPFPYLIKTEDIRLSIGFNDSAFQTAAKAWLMREPMRAYEYSDSSGSRVRMKAEPIANLDNVCPMHCSFGRVDPEPVRKDFKKKSHQHKLHRHADDPYIVALYYEDMMLGPDEVLDIMFGLPSVQIERVSGAVVRQGRDGSGELVYRNKPIHTTVSSVLVFRQIFDEAKARRFLKAWYIENPYAKVRCNPSIFPVLDSFLVRDRAEGMITMSWGRQGTA